MADIKVVIQLQNTSEKDEIKSLESPTDVNNASIQKTEEHLNKLSTKSDGSNLKSWATGSLALADGYVGGANTQLIEQYGYNGYVFGVVPDNKQFTVTLEIVGKNIDSIIVYGDNKANQFPTKAYIDGNPNDIIYSDDFEWAIKFPEQSNSHTITFLEWNRARYNACITYVSELKNELTLDKTWIKSVESLSQSTGQPKDIYYGVTPSSGEIDINDINGEIYDLINDGLIKNSDVQMELVANGNVVSRQISNDTDYSQSRELHVDLYDNLSKLDTLYYRGYKKINEPKTLYELIVDVLSSLDSKYTEEYISSYMMDDEIKQHTNNILYATPYISYNTYRAVLDNICNIAQLNIVWDRENHIKFIKTNKIVSDINSVLVVPSKMQQGQSQKDIILKNKIDCVKYNNSQIIKDIDTAFETKNVDTYLYNAVTTPINYEQHDYIRGNSAGAVITQGARVEGTVATGSFEIKKRTDVLRAYNNVKVSVNGKKYTYISFPKTLYSSDYDYKYAWESSEDSLRKYNVISSGTPASFAEPISSISLTYNSQSLGRENTLSISHNNYVSLSEQSDKYVVSYSFLVYSGKFYVEAGDTTLRKGEGETNLISSLDFSINGDIVRVSFTDITKNIGDENSENYYTLKQNELLQDSATINGENIGEYVSNDILSNYNNGISTGKISVCCLNIYDILGNKVRDWSKGEIFQLGDVLRIDKDNLGNSRYKYADGKDMYFRVTGRKFRYSGVPMLDLELQEVKIV